jgi:GST-like protein
MLEECAANYRVRPVDINNKESLFAQLSQLALNKKIPVLVDTEAGTGKEIKVSESGAILIYLAEKYQRFIPTDPLERYRAIQWLMFQMSAVGPIMGQLSHFKRRGHPDDAYALERFATETHRLHAVMEQHLSSSRYFAGGQYSIADMAIFPWLRVSEKLGFAWPDYPRLRDWFECIRERPAVQRALGLPRVTSAVTT